MDERIMIATCFVLLIIIIFLMQCMRGPRSETMIHGFWNISEQFKEKANLDQFIIYFDEGKGYDYNGYIVMVVDGDTVFNGTLKFRVTPKGYFKGDDYEIQMSKKIDVMPQKMTLELCPYDGCMILKCLNSKKIYAVLYKDNQMSAKTILKIADDSPDEPEKTDDSEGI